jgi:hypothetical protein
LVTIQYYLNKIKNYKVIFQSFVIWKFKLKILIKALPL